MNLAFPNTDLLSCSAAFVPWMGGLAAKATVLLIALLVVGALMTRRRAPLRHLMATLGLLGLILLPLLSLSVSWETPTGSIAASAFSAQPSVALAGAYGGLATVLLAAWGAVASLLLAWLALDLGLLWWHIHRSTHPLDQRHVARLSRRVGIRRPVRVLSSDALDIPCTWGVLRPVILLPRRATTWTREQLDAVLLHELGHVRRMDSLFVILSRITCALYWFHPLVWWVHRRAREDAERACDLLVLEEGVSASRYARHLLEIIRSARRPGAALAPTMASPSQMARRIVELTELTPTASRVGKAAASFVLFTVILSTVLLAVASVPGTPTPQEEALACSEVRPLLESPPDPAWEGLQSVGPELFTPEDSY